MTDLRHLGEPEPLDWRAHGVIVVIWITVVGVALLWAWLVWVVVVAVWEWLS